MPLGFTETIWLALLVLLILRSKHIPELVRAFGTTSHASPRTSNTLTAAAPSETVGEQTSDAVQVTRRPYKNTGITLPQIDIPIYMTTIQEEFK